MPSASRSALAALLLLLPGVAAAGFKVDPTPAAPKVAFHANGEPGALDIDAKTADLSVSDDGTTLTFTVALSGLDSGIALRDEHMTQKYLQVGTYPTATLSFPRSAIAWPTELGKHAKGSVDAQFTAHGVTRTVKVSYDVAKTKVGLLVDATFPYDISQHGIEVPSYLGVTVDSKQTATAKFHLLDTP